MNILTFLLQVGSEEPTITPEAALAKVGEALNSVNR